MVTFVIGALILFVVLPGIYAFLIAQRDKREKREAQR